MHRSLKRQHGLYVLLSWVCAAARKVNMGSFCCSFYHRHLVRHQHCFIVLFNVFLGLQLLSLARCILRTPLFVTQKHPCISFTTEIVLLGSSWVSSSSHLCLFSLVLLPSFAAVVVVVVSSSFFIAL